MPVRRGEVSTILRAQCRAPNSLARSRHQPRVLSDSDAIARTRQSNWIEFPEAAHP